MEDSIQIRTAIPDDAKEMVEVQRITWLATYPNREEGITYKDIEEKVSEMSMHAVERRRKRIEEKSPTMLYLVAVEDDTIIGFLMGSKSEVKNKLSSLYILPEHQGKGVGARLINQAFLWFDTTKSIVLEVAAYNTKAIEFYKKFGFVENGSTTNGVAKLPSGKTIPEIEMIK